MAKKSRRVRRKGASPRLSEAQLIQPKMAAEEAPAATKVSAPEPALLPGTTDFRTEYHYVVSDLRRIGILAAAMLGGLVILSFII